MDAMRVRAKSLELTLQAISVLTPENADKELSKASPGKSRQENLIDAARLFEMYIMGEDNPYMASSLK